MGTFALVHGAGHDGWCWGEVADRLRADGHAVVAPDLPSEDLDAGLEEYATVVDRHLATGTDDLTVVGHSLGALTAAVVAARRPTRRLVFVGGIIGDPGRSLADLVDVDADRDAPLEPDVDVAVDPLGRFRFTEAGARRALYHDCPPPVVDAAIEHLRLQRSMWDEPLPIDAWPDTEIVSIVCRQDRVVRPAWSRRVTRERLGVEPVELDTGHSPMLSDPDGLVRLLVGLQR